MHWWFGACGSEVEAQDSLAMVRCSAASASPAILEMPHELPTKLLAKVRSLGFRVSGAGIPHAVSRSLNGFDYYTKTIQ